MQQESFLGQSPLGFHRVAYALWGHSSRQTPVICVHGLTRNGRDFDRLATHLSELPGPTKNLSGREVYCPDIVGRGLSDNLADPTLYGYPQYMADMTAMIARTGASEIDWVGTSMGGIIGMLLAAAPRSPIRRLVINDVGPFLRFEQLKRISAYAAASHEFATPAEAEIYMRKIYAPFGITEDPDWKHLVAHGTRVLPDGKLTLAYDPAITQNFSKLTEDVDLWNFYDRIRCPTLVLHGEQSDILSKDVAEAMTERGPKAQLMTIPNVGHAPALMDEEQITLIGKFLN